MPDPVRSARDARDLSAGHGALARDESVSRGARGPQFIGTSESVISLSSDPAVWNAVLNNKVVQELRQSISPGDNNSIASLETDSEDTEAAASILKWILDNTKSKSHGNNRDDQQACQ
ncbi:unnamed protein product [Rhodiola kirilowii]